jgi:UDP-glucose 4-epimerase
MDRVVVTGACGGIGSKLLPSLIAQGFEVIAIDDLSSGRWENIEDHQSLTKITLDISNSEVLQETLTKFDFNYCIHLAAISSLPECQVDPHRAMKVNFLSTVSLAEICSKKPGFKSFIFASTSAVYEGVKAELLSEDLQISPILVYPQSKFFSEQYLNSFHSSRGFPAINARFFNVFGEFQNSQRKSPPLINYLVRELHSKRSPILFGWDAPPRDYISVEKVVDCIIKLMRSPSAIGKTLNICSGSSLTVKQIFRIVSNALGSDIKPTLNSPEKLWSAYSSLHEGFFPLHPKIIEMETNKKSIGSFAAIKEVVDDFVQHDVESEMSATVLKIRNELIRRLS